MKCFRPGDTALLPIYNPVAHYFQLSPSRRGIPREHILSGSLFVLLAASALAAGAAKNAPVPRDSAQSSVRCTAVLKHRLAVISMDNKTPYGQARIGTAIKDMLTTEIAKTECFVLVERDQLDKVMAEQALGQSGAIDESKAPLVGRLVGAEFVITGSLTQFGVRTEAREKLFSDSKTQFADATVDIRLISVETGQIVRALSGTGHAQRKYRSVLGMGSSGGYDEELESQALRQSLSGFADSIAMDVEKTPWTCYAVIRGDKAWLDAGSRTGIAVGQTYDVFSRGEAVKSPGTGAVIGYDEKITGVIRVEKVLGPDGAVAVLVSGAFPAGECLVRRSPETW